MLFSFCVLFGFFFSMRMLKIVRNLEPLHRDLLVALAPGRTLASEHKHNLPCMPYLL